MSRRSVRASGFLVGDALTLADIAVASPFANLALAGCAIDTAIYPRTAAFVAAVHARPSFAALLGVERQMLAA